ncbi:MAG TPA: LysR family transcriptional regulator [Solirubrobacteraceae bacterium]|nr:LysR family transcriptional regulator [Solirubrobacteraceae bacterium]
MTRSIQPAIDLRQLHYLVVVVEEGQITRAAQRLQLAQPALSQAIARLETQLGVRLLERLPRGIEPTPAGAAFYEKAQVALQAVEEAQDALHPWARSESTLRLGFLPALGPVARPWLRRFIAAEPGVELETRHLTPQDRLVELRRGRIDVELMFPPPRADDLAHEVVLRSPRYVLMHEGHPLADAGSLQYAQIANERVPGRHPSVPKDWAQEAWLMNYRGSTPDTTREQPTSADEVWALVSAGKAISVLPEFMVKGAAGHGVRAVLLADVEPVEVALARRCDDDRRPVLALFEAAERAEA